MRILRGEDIRELGTRGIIIRERFRPGNCEGITYNLTLGSRVQSISKTEQGYKKIEGALVLDPSESVNVEINEKFKFADMEGRPRYFGLILASARLLAGGVSHPATVIDPGFSHTTTLTLINLRNFPSRSFRPGSDPIAKLIVVELDPDEVPSGWEETPAYMQSGPDDLPVLWSDFHLMPAWRPVLAPSLNLLEDLGESYGPPFDVIGSHLLEQRRLMYEDDGSPISSAALRRALREQDVSLTRAFAFASQRIDALERFQRELDSRSNIALSGITELQESRISEKARLQEDHRDSRRYWITIIIALVAAVLGAAVSILFSHFGIH
jgi:deoxycytidine triphosphate deaminase